MIQPDLVSKLRERIADYLKGGGLFNPEMAEHDRVRDLLIDCNVALMGLESLLGGEGQAAQEALCGTAGSATISTNEAGHRTAMDVSPSEELLSRPHRIVSHEQMESVLNAPEPNVTVNPDGSCSPSTPIVPSTAGLSAEQVRHAYENAFVGDEGDFERMADRLNALLGAVKPAEPEPTYTHFDPQTHVVTVIPASVEAQIRKDVLEEAAQLLKYYGHSANLVDEVRALAERPAPAGEARISRWQCPHCAHVNLMTSANCENCKIPLVNTAGEVKGEKS